MLCVKLLSVIVVILYIMPAQSKGTEAFWLNSEGEEVIYASDGSTCHLFSSLDDMEKHNKERRTAGEISLTLITKQVCEGQCPKTCDDKHNFVCGEYAGLSVAFINNCELLKAACQFGKPIKKVERTADCEKQEKLYIRPKSPASEIICD